MCPPLISSSQKSLKIRTNGRTDGRTYIPVLTVRTDVKSASRKKNSSAEPQRTHAEPQRALAEPQRRSFLMKFIGNDEEINIETKNPEFLDWKWVHLNQITELVVDFKLGVYKEVQKKVKKILIDRF